ncbi:MAG: choline-sulfatase [Alphaproteobacteria bacterium]|nr:choline-sulfatase [Alphaproteobacteria bacterium]
MSQAGVRRQPNILLVMADQLAAPALPVYGHRVVKAPHLSRLAQEGVVFDSAYCNFPICAPSRFSMLSGRLPHAIEAYDNGAEFPASIPTMAHYLRHAGYRTILCGKMHFIGPDQLHGYEERLTTDVYPADFGWTPDWRKGPEFRPTGVSMRGVVEAGPCIRSLQIDYDDEVEYHGIQRLYDLARAPEAQPFFLTISFTHPHPPFVASQKHWDLYDNTTIDLPRVAPIPYDALDEHSRWLYVAHAQDRHDMSESRVLNARRAYYGMIGYVDDKVGRIVRTLEETGLRDDTLVVFAVDHGEMLGERGMWYKQTFYEWSARVPLIVSMPKRFAPRRVAAHVSLVDLLPTFLEVAAEGSPPTPVDPLDGHSLLPLLSGADAGLDRCVISEYSSEGVCAASRMLRQGRYKYIYTRGLAPMLFDLAADADELHDLAGSADLAAVQQRMHARLVQDWDPDEVHARILASQKRRLFIAEAAARSGRYPNWAYQPFVDESKRYVRGSAGTGPTHTKSKARFPYVDPVEPDR